MKNTKVLQVTVFLIYFFVSSNLIAASFHPKLLGKWIVPSNGEVLEFKKNHKCIRSDMSSRHRFDCKIVGEGKLLMGLVVSTYSIDDGGTLTLQPETQSTPTIYKRYDVFMNSFGKRLDNAVGSRNREKIESFFTNLSSDERKKACDRFLGYGILNNKKILLQIAKEKECSISGFSFSLVKQGDITSLKKMQWFKMLDVDLKNGKGSTLLIEAVKLGRLLVVHQLLSLKPDITIKDSKGKIALDYFNKAAMPGSGVGNLHAQIKKKLTPPIQQLQHLPVVSASKKKDCCEETDPISKQVPSKGGNCISSVPGADYADGLRNVSIKGRASQSSTGNWGWPAAPELAIDGNTDGNYMGKSVSHTLQENHSWWQVDLINSRPVKKIVIWNRTDGGWGKRLINFNLLVLDSSKKPIFEQTYCRQGKSFNPAMVLDMPANIKGQFVKIVLNDRNYLQLAEVEVFSNN